MGHKDIKLFACYMSISLNLYKTSPLDSNIIVFDLTICLCRWVSSSFVFPVFSVHIVTSYKIVFMFDELCMEVLVRVCACVPCVSLIFYHKNNIDSETLYIYIGSKHCWFVILFVQHTHTHTHRMFTFNLLEDHNWILLVFPFEIISLLCLYFFALYFCALRSIWNCLPSNKSLEIQLYILIACMCNGLCTLVCAICAKAIHTRAVTDTWKWRTNWSIVHLLPGPSHFTMAVKNVFCRKWYLCRKKKLIMSNST